MRPVDQIVGYGSATTGGAGKPVCQVTSLLDNTFGQAPIAGSLRDILTGAAGSTCIFASNGGRVTFSSPGEYRLHQPLQPFVPARP